MDPALAQRRPKIKKNRRRDINTNHLQLYDQLKPRNLQAVLIDAAVWVATDDDVVYILDQLCFGNLDGGSGTAAHVTKLLAKAGVVVEGSKAVRLSIDEAFFMAYALELLTVHEEVGDAAVPLDTQALWQRLQLARPDFLLLYLAYHHFRSKGWIARTGLQYGVDMVLYQRHPAIAHSDYSVLVLPLDPSRSIGVVQRPVLHWHDLQVTNRLTTQVGKRLLLFYVHERGDGDHSSPSCLANFAVYERVVRRWVPESQRPV